MDREPLSAGHGMGALGYSGGYSDESGSDSAGLHRLAIDEFKRGPLHRGVNCIMLE